MKTITIPAHQVRVDNMLQEHGTGNLLFVENVFRSEDGEYMIVWTKDMYGVKKEFTLHPDNTIKQVIGVEFFVAEDLETNNIDISRLN